MVIRTLFPVIAGAAIGTLPGCFGQCQSGFCPLTSSWWRRALYGGFMRLLVAFGSGTRPAP